MVAVEVVLVKKTLRIVLLVAVAVEAVLAFLVVKAVLVELKDQVMETHPTLVVVLVVMQIHLLVERKVVVEDLVEIMQEKQKVVAVVVEEIKKILLVLVEIAIKVMKEVILVEMDLQFVKQTMK